MNESELRDLEHRLTAALHASAPQAAPDLAERLLRHTTVLQQRRGLFGLSLSRALAAAAVVVLAVAVGLGIGYLLPRGAFVGGPSQSPAPSATPASSPSPTAVPESTPDPSVEPSAPASGFENGKRCTNEEVGYTVQYPADWWANEPIVPDAPELTPIAGCVAFAEEPVDIMPNSELPPGVAISAGITEPPAGNPTQPIELIDAREVEVAGRPATVSEVEWTEDAVFFRAGDRVYEYRIQLPGGRLLLFSTRTNEVNDAAAYERYKAVLDTMMETLALGGD